MVQIYRKKWRRGLLTSLWGYCRDCFILYLPVKRVPSWIIRMLYGSNFSFAFLVHPRAYQDVFISMPIFNILKIFLRRKFGFKFFAKTSPFVLNTVKTPQGVNGLVIAQLTVPEIMFEQRKETLKMLQKSITLVSKVCQPNAVVGLGGWFPMVTKRGILINEYAKEHNTIVTNGHCGTLASIFMTVQKIVTVAEIKLNQVIIAVIGVGKMGTNVARAFNGKVKKIILIDISEASMKKISNELILTKGMTEIESVLSDKDHRFQFKDVLKSCHVGICATSSYRNILKLQDMPVNFIAIDDSRPEALPRDPKLERIVLEGGLLKIKNAQIDYNYGFGEDDNVFGCLGEAFLLALDKQIQLKPTLGDVDMENFFLMLDFCKKMGVTEGDLKSSHVSVSDEDIRYAMECKEALKN